MKAIYLHSHMSQGVRVQWFDVNDTVYGLNSEQGITDRHGDPIEFIEAAVVAAILQARAKL
jgi:hypothetical protein